MSRVSLPGKAKNTQRTTGQRRIAPREAFLLQGRDIAILDIVYRLRVLTATFISRLFFATQSGAVGSQCRRRLRLLSAAGYLERIEQPQLRHEGRKPYLYFLARAGRDLLLDQVGYDPTDFDWRPSTSSAKWLFLAHQLALNDVYLAFRLAAPTVGWTLERWVDDRFLRQQHAQPVTIAGADGRIQEVAVVPDAYIQMSYYHPTRGERRDLHFFVELDRATMVATAGTFQTHSWSRRVRAYQAYVQSQAILDRYQTQSIRVLTVTTGAKRLASLKAATETAGGAARYWFTTHAEISKKSVLTDPIWFVAGSPESVSLIR